MDVYVAVLSCAAWKLQAQHPARYLGNAAESAPHHNVHFRLQYEFGGNVISRSLLLAGNLKTSLKSQTLALQSG